MRKHYFRDTTPRDFQIDYIPSKREKVRHAFALYGFTFFRLAFFSLVVLLVFRSLVPSGDINHIDFNFSWLLRVFEEAPVISDSWITDTGFIFSDWSIHFGSLGSVSFNWLKSPIEYLFTLFRPLFIILHGIGQATLFIAYFLAILFGLPGTGV